MGCVQNVNGKFKIQCFGHQYTVFYRLIFKGSKHGLRVKLYINDLRGNKNYFELVGGSSYRGFELPRVKLQ